MLRRCGGFRHGSGRPGPYWSAARSQCGAVFFFKHHLFTEDLQRRKALKHLLSFTRVLQGRDERSVHALIPDPRVLERGFHDVTIVDMGDLPEPSVSLDDISLLW